MSFIPPTFSQPHRDDFWDLWYSELHRSQVGLTFRVKRVLHSDRSAFQRIDVLETQEYGRILVLFGSVMFTERDEFVYHEMMVHVPAFVGPAPKQVLIVGGGDGGTLREVLTHPEVERATLVEIDQQVVDVCREYFPKHHRFDDPRAELHIADGAAFVEETDRKFDLILVDSHDPMPASEVLSTADFYVACKRCLAPGGALVAQTGSPFYAPELFAEVISGLRAEFAVVRPYLAWIPSYPGGLWSFTYCSDERDPSTGLDEQRLAASTSRKRFYNAAVHRASFSLPEFVRELADPATL